MSATSANSFRMEVYLPDFSASVEYCKKHHPEYTVGEILYHAFDMTKQIHFRMNSKDKSFLFRCVTI